MSRYNGIYPGICTSNQDPQRKSRLKVRVPAIAGDSATWARACVWPTPAGMTTLPSVGATLWVMFEMGDPQRPVWIPYEQRVPATANSSGIYAGICLSAQNSDGRSRIQVKVPSVAGGTAAWANGVSTTTILPSAGDTVWIMYEQGDPQYPLWLGVEP